MTFKFEFKFELDPHLDQLTEQSLQQLRRPTDLPLPDPQFIDYSPVNIDGDRHIWDNFFNSSDFPLAPNLPELAGKTVVFDLDETILMNSFISPEIWALGEGYEDKKIAPAFNYADLKPTLKGRLQKYLGRTDYDTRDRQRYPFLQHPRQIVMARPGMLHGLLWLKQQNVKLILATASARQRMEYLVQKFSILNEIFEDRMVTANEITYFYYQQAQNCTVSPVEQKILGRRSQSLAAKIPGIFKYFHQIDSYDLLVDDSATTQKLFAGTALHDKLLTIDSDKAISNYGLTILIQTVKTLLNHSLNTQKYDAKIEIDSTFTSRVEDPYYWCLCHLNDQVPLVSPAQ